MEKLSSKKSAILLSLLFISVIVTAVNIPPSDEEKEIISQIIAPFQGDKVYSQEKETYEYIEVVDSCGPYFETACVNVRKEPNINSEVITRLRNGVVLKVKDKVEQNGEIWYRISFDDEWLRYEDRVGEDWYVSGFYVRSFLDGGPKEVLVGTIASSTKRIIIDRSDQKLYAYEDKVLSFEEKVSTGIEATPTPRGIFHVYKKTPSRYMQGPIPEISEKTYDLPGVPWNLYFTEEGAVIHGAYWHDKFGQRWSNGCVNLSPAQAKKLYMWSELGTEILVRD